MKRALLVATSLLAGCAVGPNFHQPVAPTGADYTPEPLPAQTASADVAAGQSQRFLSGADLSGLWWTLFQSPALNAWIDQAIRANPDLESAKAALRVAMENVRAQQGAYFPTIAANGNASRNRNSTQLAPTLSSSALLYNLYEAQLNATWTIDVFGENRRQVEALKAQADAQRFQLESTYLAITANLVAAAVQDASLRAQSAATEDMIRAASEGLEIARRQRELGQIAVVDVATQEIAVTQLQQALPPLQKQLAQERDLLAALAGRFPNEKLIPTFSLDSLHLPEELPVSLPSKLALQRPDVRIAEENLHAASAQVGVAEANMLPNLTLSANPGTVATQAAQLFSSGTGFWSIGAGITQPIFEGGTLLHRTRAAKAAFDQARSQYKSAVITAFQNVADSLHALQSDADLLKAALASERAANTSLEISRRQLQLGSISYQALLAVEQADQQARISLIQAQAGRLADTAALFQALGGGWWNRSDTR